MTEPPMPQDLTGRVALVTGANRGIGYEIALGLAQTGATVVATARRTDAGRDAAAPIVEPTGGDIRFEQLDVSDAESVDALATRLDETGLAVDILVNNAAINVRTPILAVEEDALVEVLNINVVGTWLTKQVADDAGPDVLVNVGGPGWVATDMGGPGAPKTPTEGADTILWLIGRPDGSETGGFFEERKPVSW